MKMKFILLKKLILSILLFLIYLIIILFKGEFYKSLAKENILAWPKSISSSSLESVQFYSNNVTDLLKCKIKNNTVLSFCDTYTPPWIIRSYYLFLIDNKKS